MDSIFNTLNKINVNEHTEKKGKLTYLSWAWAWGIAKERFPDMNYTIYENPDGYNYFTDGRTAWVKTGVTIHGLEHIEYLPVMDNNNRSLPLERVTSFNVNTAIQRSLTKALARHGLGLYIYAGEDLPQDEPKEEPKTDEERFKAAYPTPDQMIDAIVLDYDDERMEKLLNYYGVKSIFDLTDEQIAVAYNRRRNK